MEPELPLVYRAKRGKRLLYAIILLIVGLLSLTSQSGKPVVHPTSGPATLGNPGLDRL